MQRKGVLILGGICLVLAIMVASRFVRIRCYASFLPPPRGLGHNPKGERINETWQLEDGSKVKIARSYFTAVGNEVTFHVEWQVPADQLPNAEKTEDMLELVRPVLRHAYGRGLVTNTKIILVDVRAAPVMRIRAEVRAAGTEQKREIVVSDINELLVWNWTFNGRAHRIFGPGYYVNTDNGRVTFTMKWHDPTLCPSLKGIGDKAAFAIAQPVLRRAAAWRLWRVVPLISPKGIEPPREHVDEVGLELGCPHKNCLPGTRCRVRGYRVTRPVEVLRGSPNHAPRLPRRPAGPRKAAIR